MPVSIDYEPVGRPYRRASDNAWIVTRYADASDILRAPNVDVATAPGDLVAKVSQRLGGGLDDLAELVGNLPLHLRPPEHQRSRAFLHDIVHAMMNDYPVAEIDAVMERLLDRLPNSQDVDAMSWLCHALQEDLLAQALGLDVEEAHAICIAGREAIEGWRPALPLRDYQRRQALSSNIRGTLETRWMERGCPILGGAARSEAIDARVPAPMRDSALLILISIANDTLAGLLGNTLNLLAVRNDLQERLRGGPDAVISSFLEEAARFCGPVRQRSRVVARGGFLAGETMIPEGALVHVVLESANRDPEAYPDPDTFDLERRGPPTLAFGAGAHICIGAVLGRRLARRFFSVLLRRFSIGPGATAPQLVDRQDIRHFERLPLCFQPL